MKLVLAVVLAILSRLAFWNVLCVLAARLWDKADGAAARRLTYGVYRSTNAAAKRAVADNVGECPPSAFRDPRLFDLVCALRDLDRIQKFIGKAREFEIHNCFFDLYTACLSGTIDASVTDAVTLREIDVRPLVLLTITADVLTYAERWIRLFELSVDPKAFTLAFLCLDLESECFAKLYGGFKIHLSSSLSPEIKKDLSCKRQAIWIARVHVLRKLNNLGFDVINCDIDAFIVGDVTQLLEEMDYDIAFQRDFSIPLDLSRKYGFIVCPGFSFYKCTPAVRHFLDLFASETLFVRDDQIAANNLLFGNNPILRKEDDEAVLVSQGLTCRIFSAFDVSRHPSYGRFVRHFGPRYFDPVFVENVLNEFELSVQAQKKNRMIEAGAVE